MIVNGCCDVSVVVSTVLMLLHDQCLGISTEMYSCPGRLDALAGGNWSSRYWVMTAAKPEAVCLRWCIAVQLLYPDGPAKSGI